MSTIAVERELSDLGTVPRVALRDCCSAIRGVTFPSGDAKSEPFPRSIACLTTSAVQDEIAWDTARNVPESFMAYEDQVIRTGDLLVSTANSKALVGKLALARAVPGRTTFGAFVTVLRSNDQVNPYYLFYALRTERARRYFFRKSSETTNISNLRVGELLEFELPLPALADQNRIVDRLTRAIDAIDLARQTIETRLSAAQALPAAYLREVFEGAHTANWKRYRLGDLVKRHNDVVHPGDRSEGAAPFVGLEHIESSSGRRLGASTVEFAKMTGRKPTFLRGQIVYGYLRPYLNKVWIAEFDGCSSVDQFAFSVREDLADSDFIAAFMRSGTFLERSRVVTTTGQLPRIGIDEIEAVPIDVPEISKQRRISLQLDGKLQAAQGLVAICQQQLAAVEAMSAALLRAELDGHSEY